MEMKFPRKIIAEEGSIDKIGEGTVICDLSLKEIGERVTDISEGELILIDNIDVDILDKFDLNDSNYLIAVGGGKCIDATKYLAKKNEKKWKAFPTVLSHDGIISERAILREKGKRISVKCKIPDEIIADLSIISSAPYRLTAAGCGDVISNISAIEDWKIAEEDGKEKFKKFVSELSLLSYNSLIAHLNEIKNNEKDGLFVLFWSLITGGLAMNFHGSSRPCSGSEHNFSHALDELLEDKAKLHGEQVALGTIISTYLQGKDWKMIMDNMKKIGLPCTGEEIGIEKEILIQALVNAKNIKKRYTVLNREEITREKAEKILKLTEII